MKTKMALFSVVFFVFARAPLYATHELQEQINLSKNWAAVCSNDYLPEKVREFCRDSLVQVRIYRYDESIRDYVFAGGGSGSVVGDHLVHTAFHIPAVKENSGGFFLDESRNTEVVVVTAEASFPAKVVDFNGVEDQALLAVSDIDYYGNKVIFDKKPTGISAAELRSKEDRPLYAFGFIDRITLLPTEFPFFLGYFVSYQASANLVPHGFLAGAVEQGFSGAAVLLDMDGRVRGMIVRTANSIATFLPGWNMENFLNAYKQKTKESQPEQQVVQPEKTVTETK